MAISCVPVLMYVKYIALRYSKITIFATACRFLIQALRDIPKAKKAGLNPTFRFHLSLRQYIRGHDPK